MPGRRHESLTFTLVVSVTVVLGALTMLALLALSGAPSMVLVATLLAALPVVPLVACFVWLDRYEPEPVRLLVNALLWGACAATAIAVVVGGIGGMFGPVTDHVSLAVVAPVTEEAGKGLFLFLLLWWRRHEIDGVLDGIVYAGLVGVGFAFTENVLYLSAAYDGTDGVGPGGVAGVTTTFLLRCVVSPFAHPLFTAFTGIGIGIAVASRSRSVTTLAPVGGFLLAVLAHGLWNASTIFGAAGNALVYAVLMVPALLGIAALALWARRSEATILTAALQDAARRGLIPATDIGWVVDLRARRAARRHALATGGPQAEQAVAEYQQALVELGFLHHRLLRGTAPHDWQVRGAEHVERIRAVRPHVAFPGQVVPTA
ncbi:PrsW family intramembrane metalloprotease [Nocardioides dongxiaopingii]|uniref:PrsW family intramembrane metalloprotease n=1 Tax=Nocardioides sp. S-1144 TaxID=2582905 RepID=UPI00110E2694|nr:PrsW family intramembrane metalloprotease [Nocardioides sp. S-1144]QCW49948.1 PrsW family intramembrane metalloprotease [Nocardioides sp. S-1144]